MVDHPSLPAAATLCGCLALLGARLSAADVPPTGLPDPGRPTALLIHCLSTEDDEKLPAASAPVVVHGTLQRLQLVVTARYESGQVRDWTKRVAYALAPEGVAQIEAGGLVSPAADGDVTVTATADGLSAAVVVRVRDVGHEAPINFPNQIVPIFTKFGCNAGGCHGKSGGQNGFALSLLGFDPEADYRALTRDSRGRRVSPAAPDESLLLRKPTAAIPHGGGERLRQDSQEVRLIREWIAQGAPYGRASDATISSIDVYPHARTLPRDGRQQLLVIARYSDGSIADITRGAQYDVNDKELAEVSDTGEVKVLGKPGVVAAMVRYQGRVCVFEAAVPLGAPVENLPAPRNYIDELAFANLKKLGLPPSPGCDDATFLRRVTLDIAGRVPTASEAREFLASADPGKRDAAIERLLASDDYASSFAQKWSALLRNQRRNGNYQRGDYLFYEWVRDRIAANAPFDGFVNELLTATGDPAQSPAVSWYRQADDASKRVEDTAQVFMGQRISCAKCHHHPYEKWSQRDYYAMAAFFSRLSAKAGPQPDEQAFFSSAGQAEARNPADNAMVKPAGLGAATMEIPPDQDPRRALAHWLVAKDNPFFARAVVNRYWKHFLGRGLVEPEDDMRETNPPSNPALLSALAEHFVASGYDLKELVRSICRSRIYQLSAAPNAFNAADRQSYSRFYPRRLPAEPLLDAVDQLTGTHAELHGLAASEPAVRAEDFGVQSYFLTCFGRPLGTSASESERGSDVNLAQALTLLNSDLIHAKIHGAAIARLASAEDPRSDELKIADLYFAAFARPPTDDETKAAAGYLRTAVAAVDRQRPEALAARRREAFEDIAWTLINAKEFLFTH